MASKTLSGRSSLRAAYPILAFLLALSLSTCDLFKVGLGEKVDISAPALEITSPTNGSYITGIVHLKGTASDDTGIASVSVAVSFPASSGLSAKQYTASFSDGQWSLDFDSAALAPGIEVNTNILVTATDLSSKTSEQKIIIYVDNNPPTVKLTSPTADDLASVSYFVNGSIRFRGAADPDVANLYLDLGGMPFSPANGNNASFSIQVDTDAFSDGDVPFKLWAVDNAGNHSVESVGTLHILQSSDAPKLSFKGADNSDIVDLSSTSKDLATNKNNFKRGDTINGTISDDDGLDFSSLSLTLTNVATSAATTFSQGATDSDKKISIKTLGTNTDPDYSSSITSASFSFTIPSDMPQGIYRLSYSLSDSLAAKLPKHGGAAWSTATSQDSGIYFVIDDGQPTTTIASPLPGAFVQSLQAQGIAQEGLGIKALEYQIDGTTAGAWTQLANGANDTPFSWNFSQGGLSEGGHKLYARAISSGNFTGQVVSVDFTIDTTPPSVQILSASPASTGPTVQATAFAAVNDASVDGSVRSTVNGVTRIKGFASDTAALKNVSWVVSRKSDGAVVDQGTIAPAQMASWSFDLDTTSGAYTDGARYVVAVNAEDKAGNSSVARLTIDVNQASDNPTLSLSGWKAAADLAHAKENLLVSDPRLSAVVYDDDWADASSVQILFNKAPGDAGATWKAVPSTSQADGSAALAYGFSSDGASGTALPEGPNYFYLRASDTDAADGRKAGKAPATTTLGPIYFVIDTIQPTISFSQSGGLYVSSSQALSGTVSSGNALDPTAPLSFTPAGGSTTVLTASDLSPGPSSMGSHTWSYTLDVSGLSDGPVSITAVARDEYGLAGSANFIVTVDKTPPVVAVTNAATAFSDLNGYLLAGNAKDVTSGLQQMTAVVKSGTTDVSSSTVLTLSSVTGSPNAQGNWNLDLSGLATGTYTVDLTATDKAGNPYPVPTFSIIVDRDIPFTSVDDAGGKAVDGAVYNAASIMPASWSGQATDLYFASGKVSFDGTKVADLSSSGSWSVPANWGSLAEGKHTLKVEVTDQGGNSSVATATFTKDTAAPVLTIVKPALSSWIEGTSSQISGTADDGTVGTGVTAIYYKVDLASVDHSADSSATILSGWSSLAGAVSWSDAIDPVSLGEGRKKLWVSATDAAGNWSTPLPQAFGIDQNRPGISETEIGTDSKVNRTASFDIAGAVSDTNPDGAPTLTLSVDGGAAQPVTLTGGAYRVTITVDAAGHTTDGDHTYVLTTTDVSGKTNTPQMKRIVHIDTSAPAVTLGNLAADGSTVILDTSVMKIMGSVTDATAIASARSTIEFSSDYGTSWAVVEADTSLGSPSGLAWSFSKSLAGAAFSADGLYRISVTASDSLGNSASSVALNFYLDRKDPVVGLDALAKTALKKAFTATGTASSANLTGVSWSLDGGTATALVGPFELGTANNITIPFTQASVDGLSEGPHKLELQASSLGGRIGRCTLDFTVDRSAPSATFTNISAMGDSVMTESGPKIIGTASDATAVALVERKIERYNGASWDTISDFTAMGSASGTSYTWTADLSNAATYVDGQYRITIRTTDDAWDPNTSTGSAVVFFLDRAVPTATIASPASGAAYNQGFTVAGTATDANLTSVSAKLDGVTDLTVAGGASWSITLSTAQVQAFSEGAHSISVIAKDVAGNSSIAQVLSFRTDKTVPSLSWFNISGAGGTVVQDSAPKISGTLMDASGIASATATLEKYDYSTGSWSVLPAWNATPLDVTGSPTSYSWSVDISSSATYPDGRYRLTIAAKDITTPVNSLSGSPVMFMLSRSNPSTSVVGPAMGTYQSAAPVFWGKASDPNGITSVLAKTGDGSAVDFFESGTTAALAGVAVTLDPATDTFSTTSAHGLQDGDQVYVAKDETGSLPSAVGAAVSPGTAYYAVSTATTSFKLSLTSGGTAIDFSSPGSALFAASTRLTFGKTATYWLVPALGLNGASDGAMTAWVRSTAGSGKTSMASRDFTLDATKPVISISSPSSGTRSVGSLNIAGTTSDPGSLPSGITGTIQYQIGIGANLDNPSSWTNSGVTGGAYSWAISLGLMSAYANDTYATKCDASGNPTTTGNLWKLPIYFQAADKAGNVRQEKNYWLILDPDGNIPVVTITQPSLDEQTYGGEQRITGMATQPVWIHDVEVAIDPSGGTDFPEAVSAAISGSTVSATGHGLVNGRSVYFSATSSLPKIGGVSVSASIPYFVVNASANSFQVATKPDGSALTFSDGGSGVTVGIWGPATLLSTGNSVMWYHDINLGNYLPQGGATSQTISVQARAWNSPAAGGATRGNLSGTLLSPRTMKFDSTFPKIQGMKVSPTDVYDDASARSYYSQISVGGQVYVLGYVVSSKGIRKIEKVETSMGSGATALYDTNGGSFGGTSTVTPPDPVTAGAFPNGESYQLIITSLGDTNWNNLGFVGIPTVGSVFKPNGPGSGTGTAIPSDNLGNFSYYFAIPVDTSSGFPDTSGVYSFDVRATDMTTPSQVSSQSIALGVDNYYPTAAFLSSSSMVGTQFQLQGTATDVGSGSGTISGFKRVVVYLTRSGSVINMLDGTTSPIGTLQARNGSMGTLGDVAYPATTATGVMASIDDLLENNSLPSASGFDRNGDGFYEYLGMTGTTYNWDVQIDSTKIADGPATVHYVAFDSVGNATHYEIPVYVRNNAPSITAVTLGTDLNGDGTVGDIPSETTTYGQTSFAATGFLARNNKLSFSFTTAGGNGQLYYSVSYLDEGTARELVTLKSAGSFIPGRLYRIAVAGASPAFTSIGAANNSPDTIFVASGAGSGTGAAYELSASDESTTIVAGRYYYVSAAISSGDATVFGAAATSVGTRFTATSSGSLSGSGRAIQVDTLPSSSGSLAIYTFPGAANLSDSSLANDRTFVLRVYDSTTGTTPGVDSLDASATVALAIKNVDNTVPTVTMNQLYWNSATDNSIYGNSAVNGHIDLGSLAGASGSLADTDPRASGKIRYEGTISDDQRIQYVRMRIASGSSGFDFAGGSNYGGWHTVASWNPATKTLVGLDDFTGHGWKFTVTNETMGASGHSVSWKFEWDTSKIRYGADLDVVVQIEAQDFRNPGVNAQGTTNFGAASRKLDVVPYILKISFPDPFNARLVSNAMNPGKGGYYPLIQGASVTVEGFNLLNSKTQTSNTDEILVGSTQLPIADGGFFDSRDKLIVSIPTGLTTSGTVDKSYITVTTNSISSINNVNDVTQGYNRSYDSDSTAANQNRRQAYIDDQVPSITVAAFGSKFPIQDSDDSDNGPKNLTAVSDYTENVPYSGTDKTARLNWLGHVEYANYGTFTANQSVVSGQVTFKGKAADNQQIGRITATIGTPSAGFDGGTGIGQEFTLYTLASGAATATVTDNGWAMSIEGTDYKLVTARVNKGHVLNWNFTWNSAKLLPITAKNVVITFKVYDANTAAQTNSSSITVDVAPYITSIANYSGQGLGNAVLRSSNGKYSMDTNDTTKFAVTGFNLGSLAYPPTSCVSPGVITSVSGQNPATTFVSSTSIQVAKKMTQAKSGYFTVFVNGIPSINNFNTNSALFGTSTYFNREVDITRADSSNWTDDRYLWFWSGTTTGFGTGQTYYYPSMLMKGTQPIFAYCNNNDGYTYLSSTDSASTRKVGKWYARNAVLAQTADATPTYFIADNEDNFTGTLAGFLHVDMGISGTAMIGDGSNPYPSAAGEIELCGVQWDGTALGGNTVSRQLNRFKYPNMIVSGNNGSAQVYLSYFDAHPSVQQIQFFAFRQTSATTTNLNEPGDDYLIASNGNIAVSGTANASSQYTAMAVISKNVGVTTITASTDIIATAGHSYVAGDIVTFTGTLPTGLSANTTYYVISPTTTTFKVSTTKGGATVNITGTTYSGVTAVQSDIVIAYYDPSSTTLKLAYSGNAVLVSGLANTTNATWTSVDVDSSPLTGNNVSMLYDPAEACLYLAYNDGENADLKLSRVGWSDKAVSTIVVDSYQSVGIWTNIQMISGVPYITYYNNSYNGTRNSIKIAYPVSSGAIMAAGAVASTQAFTGAWECMSVPAASVPQGGMEEFNRTMIGSYATSGPNEPVVGWLGTPRLEYSMLQPNN